MHIGRLLPYLSLVAVAVKLSSAELPIIVHPESLAGPWEASVANGSTCGNILVVLRLETVKSGNLERLARIFVGITVGPPVPDVQPANGTGAAGDVLNGWAYTCSGTSRDCEFNGTRLLVKAFRGPDVNHDLDLDVTFDAGQGAWRGRFTQDKVTAEVRLDRPHRGTGIPEDALAGNWRDIAVKSPYCLHARQKSDGELLMWMDETRRYGVHLARGNRLAEGNRVTFGTGEFYGRGPHFFDGVFSADGLRFEGYWDGDDRREHPSWSPAIRSVFVRAERENCSQP